MKTKERRLPFVKTKENFFGFCGNNFRVVDGNSGRIIYKRAVFSCYEKRS
jgi:hypothetical protein